MGRMLSTCVIYELHEWYVLPNFGFQPGPRLTSLAAAAELSVRKQKRILMADAQFKLEISANAVAWYGAIVATLGALTSLYNVLRDKARVKITYQKDMQVGGIQNLYDPNKTYVDITVINKGRRPIRIAKVAVRTVGKGLKYLLLTDSFFPHVNKILTEEDPTAGFLLEQNEDLLASAWYICVYDGTGKVYRKFMRISPPSWRAWWDQLRNKPKA